MRDDGLELIDMDPQGFVGQLNFVHKRIGGALKGAAGAVISGGNPIAGAATGFITKGQGRGGPSPAVQAAALPQKWPYTATVAQLQGSIAAGSAGAAEAARELARRGVSSSRGFGPAMPSGGGDCPGAFSIRGPNGTCVDVTALPPGGRPAFTPQVGGGDFGAATYGRYGLALQPAVRMQQRLKCPRGMVLGDDNLCYESLPKRDRKWNPGTKPLLTGGEMAAISKAARAAGKLHRTQKRLKKVERVLSKVT